MFYNNFIATLNVRFLEGNVLEANDYKEIIICLLEELNDSDKRFLIQIYTLIKLHIEKNKK